MATIYKYRVLKSTWGIAIDLVASSSTTKPPPIGAIEIAPTLWLNITAKPCADSDRMALVQGLRMIADRIKASVPHPKHAIVITITKVDYAPSDFQSEGLIYAIVRWAEEEFGFKVADIEVKFNKAANKYEFDFGRLGT
jgi:hypothetical protein